MNIRMYSPPTSFLGYIERAGVITQLNAIPRSCVIYVHAPIGFGKTTAVAQWTAGQNAAWFTPDVYTSGTVRFYRGILTALSAEDTSPEPTLELFLEAIQQIRRWPSSLVIDDLHLIDNPEALQALSFLRTRMPVNIPLVLISRLPPPPALKEYRTVTKLAFSRNEIEAFCRKRGTPVTGYAAELLLRQTGGWPAVLSASLQDGAYPMDRKALNRFLRGQVSKYYHDFVKLAVCDTLNPELCAAVTGNMDAWASVIAFSRETGLASELPGGAYRFYPLLREFLEHELLRDDALNKPTIYTAAANWYKKNNSWLRALSFAAKSGDLAVADEISRYPSEQTIAVNVTEYAKLIEQHFLSLPAQITKQYPNLSLHCRAVKLMIHPDAEGWAEFLEEREYPVKDFSFHGLPTITCNFPFFHKRLRDYTGMSPKELPSFSETMRDKSLSSLLEAGLLYERGELTEAERLLPMTESLPPEVFFCARALYTEIRRNLGKKNTPEHLGAVVERDDTTFLRDNFVAFQTETELFSGDRAAAEIWLNRIDTDELPCLHNLYRCFVTARAFLASGRLSEAEALLEMLAPISWEYRRNADFIEAHTLLAVCRWRMKRPEAAIEAVIPALVRAAELELIMPVAREGGDILPVLQKVQNRLKFGYDANRLDRAFVNVLYRKARSVANHVPGLFAGYAEKAVKLSPRQAEVLRYLEQNLSYREIAQKMVISTATVDDHIRKLHEKLDVSTTRELLNRAAELGL